MTSAMTKRERLQATIRGQEVDRPAVALWRHFPGDDQNPQELAKSTVAFQSEYDWDFIKVSPASSFCLKDWGAEDAWVGGDEGDRRYTKRVVQRAEDWANLRVLDPTRGVIGGQLRCLAAVQAAVRDTVPYIQTIFSPLSQAKNLAGVENVQVHLRQHPRLLHAGLEIITESIIRLIRACKPLGIAGIYYALQLANFRLLSEAEYREFGERYDSQILAAASDLWFNMLHLHGPDPMFDLAARLPVQAINWHDREAPPSLAEGKDRFSGAVSGGLDRLNDMLKGNPSQIRAQVEAAIQQTGGRRLIVGCGCVTPVTAPLGNLRAVRAAVEGTSPA